MESLIVLAVLMATAYKIFEIMITAIIVVGAVMLVISVVWGVYDRVKKNKEER